MRNAELNNENVRLQSTVQQQEAKIEEFQHTIRILNRKIVVLEDTKLNRGIQNNETPSTKCNNKPTNETDQLVLAMRDRMTKLVLKRVDEQIKLMEDDSEISTRYQGRRINNNNYHIQSENTSTYDRDQQHRLHTQQQSASYPCRNIQDIHEPIINAQTIPTAYTNGTQPNNYLHSTGRGKHKPEHTCIPMQSMPGYPTNDQLR